MTKTFVPETGLPTFDVIPGEIYDLVEQKIQDSKDTIERTMQVNEPPTWKNFCLPLDMVGDSFNKLIGPISHLTSVRDTDELRNAYESCIPIMTEYSMYMGQNKPIYERFYQLYNSKEFRKLSVPQKKAITNSIDYFERAGVAITEEDKPRFQEISQRLAELSNTYSNNILDAKKAWFKHITDVTELDGMSENDLATLEQAAKAKELEGYVITLDAPNYGPVLEYCSNRELRKEVFYANATKASEIGPHAGQWDNGPLMNEMLELKNEKVAMLGFEDYASYSIDSKMAETTQEVLEFLYDIAAKSTEKAKADIAELIEFSEDELGLDTMERWDLSYCSMKLMKSKYEISSEILKPYFPMKTVLRGLFTLISRLYGVEFKADRVDTWNKDVTYYDVLCDGEKVAGVFLDPYARSDKQGGAWMNNAVDRFRTDVGDLQLPVAYICCNFTPPNDSTPSLLTHRDVETLFHEFGHGLHHMLTQMEVLDVSGISGVEWDAVELPSQFMENWCWDRESLNMFSGHYVTGEKLPDDLFDKLVASKHFMSGYALIRQIEMSLFDFRLHMEYEDGNIFDILDSAREEVGILPAAEFDRLPNSFSHIFGGGYAAGYYSYSFSLTLSSDAFSLFEENGIFDKETADSFKKEILEMGGSRKAMDSFVAFRGRKPTSDAMLRHLGIVK